MAPDEFNIDEAEDFDDGTRAVVYDDGEKESDTEIQELTRLRSSRKQRLEAEHRKGDRPHHEVSALRVKNWDMGEMESTEYAGKVVERQDLNEGGGSPEEDAMAEWLEAEPFETSEEEEEKEEIEDEEKDKESTDMLIRGFQKEDSARLMGVQDSEKVVEKAKHVRNQKLVWERCLEMQIYTKRLLTAMKDVLVRETTDEEAVTHTKKHVVMELYKSIEAVSVLQEKLCNVPELSAVDVSTEKRKRSCGELWQDIASSSSAMLPQYNEILHTYTRSTDLAGGGKINQANKFKAVNQDILAQVELVLVDSQRVKRKAHAPLDAPGANAMEGALDELMYDDSDFYQQLLKEFIESGGGGASQDGIVRRTHRKKKKTVNRKASKGRQLRYTVHPKLENFMFPEPYPKPEMDVTELFRSLFGQVRQ